MRFAASVFRAPLICPGAHSVDGLLHDICGCGGVFAEDQAARSPACRKFVTVGGRVFTMSFTHRRNRVGERRLPYDTPSRILISLLRDPSSFTLAILWQGKLLIHLYI